MKNNFNLSEKIVKIRINSDYNNYASNCFYLGAVEEFIKRFQHILHMNITNSEELEQVLFKLDKLIGEKLR